MAIRSGGQVPVLLRERGATERRHPGALRGDGWQVFDVSDTLLDDADLLPAIAAGAGSPVLAAYVADSDYGWLAGVGPAGPWCTWLDSVTAFEFERDHQITQGMTKAQARRHARRMVRGFGVPPRRAARYAVAWAADAGYAVGARPIRQILAARRPPGIGAALRLPWKRYIFAEEMFFDLLDQVGIPREQQS